ncbi:ROK family protein [Actinomyces sp. 594]|uniref:ROK family protein n=1 Tax=Actinomyces sp. 594 TaxID=2057793 RepID=UPI001C57DA89|nr:ROK family protein [Actinomyces sp. 594]MBW3069648.1 ROK family protein [Actinomyces sp. 594]
MAAVPGRDGHRPTPSEVLVGVDVGGTKIAAARVDAAGALRGPVQEVPTPSHAGPAAMLDTIAGLVVAVAADGAGTTAARRPGPVAAVGIGAAGVIDTVRGTVVSATDAITGWSGTDVAGGVAERLAGAGLERLDGTVPPVYVDNDVNAYAAGEAWIGAGAGAACALVVAVGTGVGGAVILDGSVHHGAHFLAGEMGHMPCGLAAGERCTCGRPGHLEAVAAGPQIARRYREATGAQDVVSAHAVERLARAGDPDARRLYREAATALGQAIAGVVTVLDPDRVIISGGLARSGRLWWDPLRETVRRELIEPVATDLPLVPAALGTAAPIIGAAHEAARSLSRAG